MTGGSASTHKRVLKLAGKRRSLEHTQRYNRKLNQVLDSYKPSVCSAFAQVTETAACATVDLSPQAAQAIDLIVADFVERLVKQVITAAAPGDAVSPHSVRRALKSVVAEDSALFDTCVGLADHYLA
eukprot:Gregarina_sp_Pseudo_9__1705@NODE_2155_length_1124_cov_91_189862_g1984_i0_p2_GENE_NODE_2155_length_1124_cov_91_189862_g1984_i0NODE_2155_length_1124_cov_91_189862_g1984_i0_p2_ORF_typecomplete_len127_score27_84Borrelia_REV/PF03978_13/0_093_NODE_2155_length_1124_cov_91_189862_g1984_i087467